MEGLVDTHAHLDDPGLPGPLDAVLGRAKEAGVAQVVAIATSSASSARAVEIAKAWPGVYAAVGIQPNHVAEAAPGDFERVVDLAGQPRVVAIGETGLDRHWHFTPFDQQQTAFDRHLALAAERDLPVVIHCRDCEADIVAQLARLGRQVSGVLHSFTGTWNEAKAFLELGLHISFAGMITFTNKKLDGLREVAAQVPLDRLLVETDSPYLSPHPHRGQPNEPARVAFTAACVAKVRQLPVDEVARATSQNARRLFRLSPDDFL
jgi:TatD DNase family protein